MGGLVLSPASALGSAGKTPRAAFGSARWHRSLAAAIAVVLFWAQSSIDPDVGPDPSWQAGLAMARSQNLAWGPDILFTFGPLGFLQNNPYYTFDQTLYATIYQPAVIAALFLGIAAALRCRHTPMRALIGAFITTGVVVILHAGHGFALPGLVSPELAVLAAFAWAAVPLLQPKPKQSLVVATCLLLGVVAGIQLLVKLNTGIFIAAIALAVSALTNWKAISLHCMTLATFAASIPIFWTFASQPLANLPTWLKLSADVVSGYIEGEALPVNAYTLFAAFVCISWLAVLGAIFLRGVPEISRRFILLVMLVTVIGARVALGRCGVVNLYFLIGFIVISVAITPLGGIRPIPRRMLLGFIVAVLVVALGTESAVSRAMRDNRADPMVAVMQSPLQVVDRLVTLAVPGRFDQRMEQVKARQRSLYNIPDRFIDVIGRSPVHVDPNEASAVWAHGLTWLPVPAFQSYLAYTPTLDGFNSVALAAKPRFVLSRLSRDVPATGIDGRLQTQESPRYSRTLMCDYSVFGIENRWALFTPTRHHCGPLKTMTEVTVRDNDVIAVPTPSRPDAAVLVGIDLQHSFADWALEGNIAPLSVPTVVLDGVTYRIVTANAAEPFLINSPKSVEGTNLEIHARTIGMGRVPSTLGKNGIVARLRFYETLVS